MSNFLFDGRSRPNRMQLVSDNPQSKEKLLQEARRRQQKREEDRRRGQAASRIQRAVRQLLAQQRLLCLALGVLDALPAESDSSASPLTPKELGTACWSFQYVRDHVAKLPTTAFLSAESGNEEEKGAPVLTKAERIARAHGVVRRCSGKLVTAVRVVLQRGARAREGQGNFVDLLTELPPAAAGFLALVLLEDYSASLAEKNGSGAERAFRGLDELCRAAVSAAGVTNSSSSSPQREAVQDSRVATLLVSIVSSCLAYAAAHPELQQSARSRLVGLLTPLVPLCAPAVALLCSAADTTSEGEARADLAAAPQQANDNEEEGETEAAIAATLPSPEDSIRSQAWADGCWASLTSSCDDGYLSLTGNPIAALLSAQETKTSSPTDAAATTSLLMVLQVAYDRIVRDSFMDGTAPSKRGREPEVHASPSPTTKAAHASPEAVAVVANARWWETSAMAVLGRLTRMLPLLLSREGVDAADAADDSDGAAVARRLARVVWLRCVGALCERLCQTESFTQGILFDLHHSRLQLMSSEGEQQQQQQEQQQRGGAAVANAHCGGKYRALASYLFSSEGGLRLMEQLATASGEDEDGGADRDTYRAPMPQHFFPANEEAQLLSLNVLESICGVYAWPLFTFSLSSPQNRLETSAVFAKLVHTPQLLRQLWCLYRSRCDGLAALLPAGELLEKLCRIATTPNVAVRMPVWRQPPPSLLAAKGLRGRQGMFWDPNPAFAALFFTLLGYYIDVTDFTQELQRGTVFTEQESWALILALKEIVHRAHFHGVVPGENCEAVAHVAYILLAKLHVINESSMFVPYPSLWISTADPSTMHVLGNITGDQWDTLSEKRVGEQRRLEHKLDGLGEDDGASASGDDDEEGESSGKTAGGLLATAHFLSAKNNPAKAKAAAAAAAARAQRCPGSDIVFDDSANWPLEERIVRLLLHTPFTIPFPERAALLTMFLLNTQPSRAPGRPRFFVVHRGRTFVDTFERFHNHPDSADMYSVRFAAAARDRQSGRAAGGNNNAVRRAQDAVRRAFFGNPEDEDGEDMDDVMGDLTGQAGQRPPADPEDGTELPDEGLEEGYGQGVYRELMVSVCKEGFDASHGLFLQTEDGYVYPNPFSFEATGDPLHVEKIRFLGTMVGRAFRDGILQDYPFALHFRNALLGRRNSINNLRSYDAQLYQQLMSLGKMSREELESMGLTFTYDVNALGITREVELIKGGATIPVTQTNCLHYIQLVADFKLNREGAQQMQAFRVGLEAIIKPSWLQLFDSNELLNLLGGDQTGRIDLADWRKHATYYPPEAANSEPVRIFWEVVTSLTNEQQSKLLKFATSMNRPPLLGFRFLSPPFNIHMLSEAAVDRLPSASTCFSMLKLPPYRDYATARAKIIAAIEETNSFGLT